ncbi:phage tail protein [Jiulongibacter sp. NS-SX5]|uniref:phage tail protein n=1 Tax=Jiulongibacter sp. NS-SX5 TaxID=3463854 RepID=UPI0040592328
MAEPYVGEIRMFAGNFAPRGWAFCDGQLLAVSQNDALFSLFGTIYGGDGRTTFGLPDMRGRIPIHAGSGPGLTPRTVGSKGGSENVTLTEQQLPSHRHPVRISEDIATRPFPEGGVLASNAETAAFYNQGSSSDSLEKMDGIADTGGSQSHSNLMPFLCINFIVALFGIYPSRH